MAMSMFLNPVNSYPKFQIQSRTEAPLFRLIKPISTNLSSNPNLHRIRSVIDGNSEPSAVTESNPIWEEVVSTAASLYPVYVAVGGIIACLRPSSFSFFVERGPSSYSFSLGFIMLAMGITLELRDLINLFMERPFAVTLITKGDVALSIVMTVCTTLGVVLLTPLLTKILAGNYVPVYAIQLSISTLQVVVAPIFVGSYLQSTFPKAVKFITSFSPFAAVLASSLLACWYISPALGGFREPQRRAMSIEVGMQNSSLGVVLATAHFLSALFALPPAISAVVMNIMVSSLGFYWRCFDPSPSETGQKVV